jgi:ribosome-binding ATPase YchF (GTP1/OBG family)
LQGEIDVLRKELTSSRNETKKLTKEIANVKQDAEEENKRFQNIARIGEDTRIQIIALQAKYEEEKQRFDNEIAKHQDNL